MPLILGHEIAGTVVDVGPEVRAFKVGQRVCTAQRYHICGACRYCRTGRETSCPDRRFLGDAGMVGGHGQHVAVEDDNAAHVPGADGRPSRAGALALATARGYRFDHLAGATALSTGYTVTGSPPCHWRTTTGAPARRPFLSNFTRPPAK